MEQNCGRGGGGALIVCPIPCTIFKWKKLQLKDNRKLDLESCFGNNKHSPSHLPMLCISLKPGSKFAL